MCELREWARVRSCREPHDDGDDGVEQRRTRARRPILLSIISTKRQTNGHMFAIYSLVLCV